ncbi:DNA-binding protein [Gulosibacter macacae]|uniref:DNA-binding protein n=1 Tax=Gulosibacter macacae TaxID=2488791 RepID=A0A3P3VW86_9MICO|nr:OB-fold domain-containing protein [Gulosibacter macacae]RRJ85709.1 DNA-binding protein [Gulosibacter macacae]
MAPAPAPIPTPETREFWEGTARRELRIQRCTACGKHYFHPRPFCPDPTCASDAVEWTVVSGRARLSSYVINHRPLPMFEVTEPQIIAIVTLDEGPRMMTNLIGVDPDPELLVLNMPLEVDFVTRGEQWLPMFHPAVEEARR